MKKIVIISCFILCANHLPAQTKEIAFKSHSGTRENFINTIGTGLFDEDSDFGVAPIRSVKNAELDSVIFISDSVAIMVTSEYCRFDDLHDNRSGPENLWKAGSKKVYNHPLFSKQHSLDSIKSVIRQQYHFRNSVEKIVFVGYDNEDCKPRYYSMMPVSIQDDDQSPFGSSFVLMLGSVIILSLLGGVLSWKYARPIGRLA